MAVCRIAGIHFMATAGIGGAHRGWQRQATSRPTSWSWHLAAVCVVCSGARSFLDVPATLELLESYGIP